LGSCARRSFKAPAQSLHALQRRRLKKEEEGGGGSSRSFYRKIRRKRGGGGSYFFFLFRLMSFHCLNDTIQVISFEQ